MTKWLSIRGANGNIQITVCLKECVQLSIFKENLSFTCIKLDRVEEKLGFAQYKGSPGRVPAGLIFPSTDGGELFFSDKYSAGLAESESVTLGVFM